MVVNAVDDLVGALPFAEPDEHVDFVTAALEAGREFGHMDRHPADRHRVKTLPP